MPLDPFVSRRRLALIAAGLAFAALLALALVLAREKSDEAPAVSGDICLIAPPQRYDPAAGLALLAPRPVPADARCPVCGMYPARSREWAAQLIFTNGDAHFFDTPLSLYLYLQDVGHYSRGRSAAEVAASYVTDGDTGAWVPAAQAYYVHGSSARGPMRQGNLPAFVSKAAAQQFAQQRGGKVLRAEQLSPALLAGLDTRRGHEHDAASPKP